MPHARPILFGVLIMAQGILCARKSLANDNVAERDLNTAIQ